MLEAELKSLTGAVVELTKAIHNMGLTELPKVAKEVEPEAEQVAEVATVKSAKVGNKKAPEKDVQDEDSADIKYDTIKAAILELVEKAGRDAAVGVLAEFKLKSAAKAKPEQYSKLLAAINRELKEIA